MTRIRIESGTLEGVTKSGIHAFLGVPYAAPVVPGRRFSAAEPVQPWAGVRDATALGAVCPQVPTYGPVGYGATSALASGEDFLTVNIRTPNPDGRAPVLVWLHGGGYAVGSANEPMLQTAAFAASGIVEVSINARLGALGFLCLDGHPQNRGLRDIVAALEWIRRNIAAFGGDPDRVTLAGRSAGGFAVATLMAMPAAQGLFARALIQSGATPAVLPPHDARRITQRFLDLLPEGATSLEHLPIETLLAAQKTLCDTCYTEHDFARDGAVTLVGTAFQPVIDAATLPLHPEQAAARGLATRVPVMIGTTSAEYLTHATAYPGLSWEEATRRLDPRVRPLGLTGAQIVGRYRAALPDHSPAGIWRAVGGDLVFQNPTTRYARLLSAHQNVHKYVFGAIGPDETGAAHGAELAGVWWNETTDPQTLPPRYRDFDPALGRRVHAMWCAFIRGDADEAWPRHELATAQIAWIAPASTSLAPDPFAARLALWQGP